MARYVAFLRGVTPSNLKMADLKACLEASGFERVKTVLSSGNVVFDAKLRSSAAVEKAIEAGMAKHLTKIFTPYVRTVAELEVLIAKDPFSKYSAPTEAKRVITFLRKPAAPLPNLPIFYKDVQILAVNGMEIFTTYVPSPEGPVFMSLLEKTFGGELTTRTWDTVLKCTKA